jgi:hypothetical protein
MGSCLRARRRKTLCSVFLKLFSRCLVFIVISYVPNANGPAACYDQAVVGFFDPSFEGGRKSGGERGRVLNCGSALKVVRRGSNQERKTP